MKKQFLYSIATFAFACVLLPSLNAQKLLPFRLPETGQTMSFTNTPGEDADYLINTISLTDNGDGTITDNNSYLMWQKVDGGEMKYEDAATYCAALTLAGYSDWRLPTAIELFSINHYNHINPALDTSFFTKTAAQYWWSSEVETDDPSKVWVVNAGGGIGAHPKSETVSAGGSKLFHTRAVRSILSTTFSLPHFTDNLNGTITDNFTGLIWQEDPSPQTMSWEEALVYSKTVTLAGKTDWRLPNIKELQSLNDVARFKPSFNSTFFPSVVAGNFWSSTSMINSPTVAWDINVDYGIVSYNPKSTAQNILLVRGGFDNHSLNIIEKPVPGGEYEMGDHNGHYDPSHPNDEIPIHPVRVDSLLVASTETTNQQFLAFLNSALLNGSIGVDNNRVHFTGDTNTLYYTFQDASFYSIGYDGDHFTMADFRGNHPVNGVMWTGAIAFCNWLSEQNGLPSSYNLATGDCDFQQTGYRLPTEAEWEYAGRGGHLNPYYKYPNGNVVETSIANLPNSGDPYETGLYPLTTPVGFYDGTLHLKTDYNWPSNASSYQTGNGANGFGLYDMQGNVWEFVNDWYGSDYYSSSTYDNPHGPTSGSVMPDGKTYRGMRGGNWYNGIDSNNVNDGHSRVSNRDPSYFRGPQDPHHPWYHVGFRVVRNYSTTTGFGENGIPDPRGIKLNQNCPNPFQKSTTIRLFLPASSFTSLKIFNSFGQEVEELVNTQIKEGWHEFVWDGSHAESGIYFCTCTSGSSHSSIKMVLIK
jgi:formylglycine-generating enzyme required for sulfatase activity